MYRTGRIALALIVLLAASAHAGQKTAVTVKFVVDAYAVQHPGEDSRKSRQSVAVHLIRLCLMLERDRDVTHATRMITRATTSGLEMKWFEQRFFAQFGMYDQRVSPVPRVRPSLK